MLLTEHDLARLERQALDFIESDQGPSFAASIIDRVPEVISDLRDERKERTELDQLFDRIHAADMRGIALWRAESPEERENLMPDRAQMVLWLLNERDRDRQAGYKVALSHVQWDVIGRALAFFASVDAGRTDVRDVMRDIARQLLIDGVGHQTQPTYKE